MPFVCKALRTSVSVFPLIALSYCTRCLKRRVPSFPCWARTHRAHFFPMTSINPSQGHGQTQQGCPSFGITIRLPSYLRETWPFKYFSMVTNVSYRGEVFGELLPVLWRMLRRMLWTLRPRIP